MDEPDLTERWITAAELAAVLGVSEDDVLRWMLAGWISYFDGPGGEPRVSVQERHSVDGPVATGLMIDSMSEAPEFTAEVTRRQRELESAALDYAEVDPGALAGALTSRFAAIAPPDCEVVVDGDMIWLCDARGGRAGVDVAVLASLPGPMTAAERVRNAAQRALEQTQVELAEISTDPWPRRGPGSLPTPRALSSADRTMVRLLYGAAESPVLELDPIVVNDVLSDRNSSAATDNGPQQSFRFHRSGALMTGCRLLD